MHLIKNILSDLHLSLVHRNPDIDLKLGAATIIGIDVNKNNITMALLSDSANKTASKVLETFTKIDLKDYALRILNVGSRELTIVKINFDNFRKIHCDACTTLINYIAKDKYTVVNMEHLDDLVFSGKCRLGAYKHLKFDIFRKSKMFAILNEPPIDIGYASRNSRIWSQVYLCNNSYVTMLTEPYRTTLICSHCLITRNTVSICKKIGRSVVCREHGRIDRDENAATNMAELAFRSLLADTYRLVIDSQSLPSTGLSSLPSPGAAGVSWRVGTSQTCNTSCNIVTPAALGEGDGLCVEGRDKNKLIHNRETDARCRKVQVRQPYNKVSFLHTFFILKNVKGRI